MATIAVPAGGTLLKIGDGGGSEVFTTIAEVKSISGFGISVNTEDVTSHDSAGWREFIGTLKEAGEISIELNFNAAATQGFAGGLYNDANNKTKRNFQLVMATLTSSKTAAFAAIVSDFKLDFPADGVVTASITLRPTGAVTVS